MIFRLLAGLVLVAGVGSLPSGAALATGATGATGATVTVADMRFSPRTVSTGLGGTVTWSFSDAMAHTTTSAQGFWDSGPKSSGQSFGRAFGSAGSYGYSCTIHPSMRGTVQVPLTATGAAAKGWTLRWSTGKAPASRNFDVQVRRSGSTAWQALRTDTTKPTAKFDPSRSGSYQVRARTSNTANGKSSGWSPVRSVTVG